MYGSLAEFWGWFLLKGKSNKTFDIVVSTKVLFLNFDFGGFGGLWRLQPGRIPPIHVFTWLNDYFPIA